MKHCTEIKRLLILFAIAGLFLFFNGAKFSSTDATEYDSVLSEEAINGKLIYTCRLADEEIPSIQVLEMIDEFGQTQGTIGQVNDGSTIRSFVSAPPDWAYKTVSAHAGENSVEIVFDPQGSLEGYDWIVKFADNRKFFRARVKDCTEIADE